MTHSEQPEREDHEPEEPEDAGGAKKLFCRPFHWHRSLVPMDRFTFWIAIFTFFLLMANLMQIVSYIESERAQVVVESVNLLAGEPTTIDGGLDSGVWIKNVGKHLATITDFKVAITVFIVQKTMDEYPDYRTNNTDIVMSPIVSQQRTLVPVRQNKDQPAPPIPREVLISGIKSGTYPLTVHGRIKYRKGYFMLDGATGFCFVYVPETKRTINQSFNTCQNKNYTYAD